MDQQQRESVVREQASGAGVHLVQSGWQVNDKAGDRIGRVIERSGDSVTVELRGGGSDRVVIPVRLIAEEDESGMLATLAVGWDELDDARPTTEASMEQPPLA